MQDDLYLNLFGNSPEDKTKFLQEQIQDFPYFSLPHFYLLKEKKVSDADYSQVAGTTALHFNNPYYLNYLLNNGGSSVPFKKTHGNDVQEVSPDNAAINYGEKVPEKPLFEPLFTTDYFASQGIRLSEDIKPDDKLGKQLRSFTDWLKTMKKVHGEKMPETSGPMDVVVQNIAEKSNTEQEVITESMADVYLSQGKPARARDIYQKLSLIYPAKSAYFAAKIDSLKT